MGTRDCNLCSMPNCPSRDMSDKYGCLVDKSKAFTEANKDESADSILAQMRGEDLSNIVGVQYHTINMNAYTENPVLRFREGRLFTQRCKVNQFPEDVDVTEAVAKAIAKYIKN